MTEGEAAAERSGTLTDTQMSIMDGVRKIINLRELGGYPAADGRTVKRGAFWRSGALDLFYEDEWRILEGLGIRHIIDLRSTFETVTWPDPIPEGSEYHHISAMVDENGDEVDMSPEALEQAKRGEFDPDFFREGLYGNLPFHNPAYRKMFELISDGQTPVLFHCSAGKDRTGIGAALILLALGADEETVLDDYELTNDYLRENIERAVKKAEAEGGDARAAALFQGVDRQVAEFTLGCIKDRYGSYEAFFEKEFGLDAVKLKGLRDMYLEN